MANMSFSGLGSTLPAEQGRSDGVVVRYRSSGDLAALGLQQGTSPVRSPGFCSGYAFSHDEAATGKQIEMIMRHR